MTALAVITARGGSKGFPGKNLAPLCGQPLIAFSIEAGRRASRVDRVVVSSDDDQILKVAASLGAHPLLRPADLASDTAASEPVIAHALLSERAEGREYDLVVLLQPTSPLRTSADVDAALALMERTGANSVISVRDYGVAPFKAMVLDENGNLRGLVNNTAPFTRRQDLPTTYRPNGAIYVARTTPFLATGSLLIPPCRPYIMSAERSIDVDLPDDIEMVAQIMRTR
jgi:CMP-N-acetylneuraminic acid synthetase